MCGGNEWVSDWRDFGTFDKAGKQLPFFTIHIIISACKDNEWENNVFGVAASDFQNTELIQFNTEEGRQYLLELLWSMYLHWNPIGIFVSLENRLHFIQFRIETCISLSVTNCEWRTQFAFRYLNIPIIRDPINSIPQIFGFSSWKKCNWKRCISTRDSVKIVIFDFFRATLSKSNLFAFPSLNEKENDFYFLLDK